MTLDAAAQTQVYATNGKQNIKTRKIFIMASVYQKELFCEVCKLQFDKKSVYDIHLSFVHGQKKPNIKSENDEQVSQENLVRNILDIFLLITI